MNILPDSVFLRIGPLTIYWYGVLIVLGLLAGAYVATREARRKGENPDHVWNGILVVAILGLIGARLYHVISSPQGTNVGLEYYLRHPSEIIGLRLAGLGIYGAVAGGLIGAWLYARVYKLDFVKWLDIVAPGMFLGQAIGRWGNFFNQELYGFPSTASWGIPISAQNRLPMFPIDQYPETTRFHPTFLYESLGNFGSFLLVLWLSRRFGNRLLKGDLFLLWGVLYGLGRTLVEFQRPDAWMLVQFAQPVAWWPGEGIATAQAIGLGLVVICGGLLILRRRVRPQRAAA